MSDLRERKGAGTPKAPASIDEIFGWLETGKVSPAEAFRLFREVDQAPGTGAGGAVAGAGRERPGQELRAALSRMQNLIGLERVKELVGELQAFVEVQRRRRSAGLTAEPVVLHMVFRGNPGTGKTTVARILGTLFKEMGLLEKGHLVEVERADLVGEYIGHTAQKTREQIKRALGGILFIDEAYSLARGGEKDFGKEAIDALVKAMEDHRSNLVLILAGYRREMDWFLRQNPGLRSRFPIHLDFPDYSVDELVRIADHMARQRDYRLTDEARLELARLLRQTSARAAVANGNARLVRNVVERAIRRQAVRLVRENRHRRDELMRLTAADLQDAFEYAAAPEGSDMDGHVPLQVPEWLEQVVPLMRGGAAQRPQMERVGQAGGGRAEEGIR